jgi:hydrogenase nickel incorporation protein HypA/HybF
MHEFGIAQEMVKVALDRAGREHASHIAQFNIEMSAWADESEESLRFYLESLSRGTIAQDARVQILRVPARGRCLSCGNEFESESKPAECPACHNFQVRAAQNDLRIVSIDVE